MDLRVAAALLALLALLVTPVAEAKRIRAFAVGPKFDLGWVETRGAYRAKLLALVDRRERGEGVRVQQGADDVVSNLLRPADPARPVETARDLVALPEDIGLLAALTGSRGRPAREVTPESGGLTAAIGSLAGTYGPQMAYYGAKYPGLAERGVPTRLLATALTDTFGRTAVETFAELAVRTRSYLQAGVNMSRSWRIVCSSRAAYTPPPTGEPCAAEDPALVGRLRDPDEPTRTYAYEATTDAPVNMALVFAPDGRLISRQVKTYLTPVELPGQLDLVPGEVTGGLSALRTPVGVLGFVTSKDAWMPDVVRKLDQHGVEVLVQPEFFVNDTVRTEGQWAPDTITAAGYSDLLRHPSIEALVLPELTGNVYDFSADNQQAIGLEPRGRRPVGAALVGQDRLPGYAVVSPWVVRDPLRPGEPFAERRRRLGEAGEAMLPTGERPACPAPDVPGPCRGGQVEGVIFADLQVDRPRPRRPRPRRKRIATPFSRSLPLSGAAAPQRNVSLAAHGRFAWAAFEEAGRIVVARSRDGARTWRRLAVRLSPAPDQWWPQLAAAPDGRLWLAWQESGHAWVASSADGGRSFSAPLRVDATSAAPQWRPTIAVTGSGRAVVTWIDEREGSAHVYAAGVGEPGRRIDELAPTELARSMDHAWAPAITARGERVLVTWTDFRTYDWRIYARESTDGGRTFGPERALTDTPAADEALDDAPRPVLTSAGSLVAWTDFRKRAESARSPHPLYDVVVAAGEGGENRVVDGHRGAQRLAVDPAPIPDGADGALVAWQDHLRGDGDIRLARVSAAGRRGRVVRVDDSGGAGTGAWRPAIARLRGGRIVVAWEDDRDGPTQVFTATARRATLP